MPMFFPLVMLIHWVVNPSSLLLFLSCWWCTWVSWYARCRWPSADRNPIVFHIFVPMFGVFVIYATSPVWTDHRHCRSPRRYCFKPPGSACGSLFSTCLTNSESTKPPPLYHKKSKSLSSVSPHPSWRLHPTHKHQTSQKRHLHYAKNYIFS